MRIEGCSERDGTGRKSKLITVERLCELLEQFKGRGLLVRANPVTLGLTIHEAVRYEPFAAVDFLLDGEVEVFIDDKETP